MSISRREFLKTTGAAVAGLPLGIAAFSPREAAAFGAPLAPVPGAPVLRVNQIKAPLFNIPAIAKIGDSFKMTVLPPEDKELTGVYIEQSAYPNKTFSLEFKPTGSTGDLKTYDALIPSAAPEALFNLTAVFGGDIWDRQPNAVKAIREFKRKFEFIHLTDIHFNVQHLKEGDMERIRRRVLQVLTKRNPEFIVLSGDLMLNPETYPKDYVTGYEAMTKWLDVPVFIVPGNHELYYLKLEDGTIIDGLEYWKANYGPTYHSFDYDNLRMLGMNSFDWPAQLRDRRNTDAAFAGTLINSMVGPTQWNWVQENMKEAKSRGMNIIAFTHIPIEMLMGGKRISSSGSTMKIPGPDTDAFATGLAENGCSNILVGHMHYNEIKQFGGLRQIMTKAAGIAGGNPSSWGFRSIKIEDGQISDFDEIFDVTFDDVGRV
ncbi:MAG: Calcineurin-like phosphoesterase [bacterium ADurb.Bin236]|nr:MAG: Calcineurin-like phosphoesterase [bacterium ADurb.Bin236]HOY62250.1 metallophosphoesterase [bacterium]HPN93930.1 metallophosphoesterase [bacterium]